MWHSRSFKRTHSHSITRNLRQFSLWICWRHRRNFHPRSSWCSQKYPSLRTKRASSAIRVTLAATVHRAPGPPHPSWCPASVVSSSRSTTRRPWPSKWSNSCRRVHRLGSSSDLSQLRHYRRSRSIRESQMPAHRKWPYRRDLWRWKEYHRNLSSRSRLSSRSVGRSRRMTRSSLPHHQRGRGELWQYHHP